MVRTWVVGGLALAWGVVASPTSVRAQVSVSARVTGVVGTRLTEVREAVEDHAARLARCMRSEQSTTVVGHLRIGVDASGRVMSASLEPASIDVGIARCVRRRALLWGLPSRGVTYVVSTRIELSVLAVRPPPHVRVTVERVRLLGRTHAPPGARAPWDATTEARVDGTSTPERWLAVLRAHGSRLAPCSSTPGAMAVVDISIGRAGRVRNAVVTQSTGLSVEQFACIEAKIRGMRFPRSPRGVMIMHPFFY